MGMTGVDVRVRPLEHWVSVVKVVSSLAWKTTILGLWHRVSCQVWGGYLAYPDCHTNLMVICRHSKVSEELLKCSWFCVCSCISFNLRSVWHFRSKVLWWCRALIPALSEFKASLVLVVSSRPAELHNEALYSLGPQWSLGQEDDTRWIEGSWVVTDTTWNKPVRPCCLNVKSLSSFLRWFISTGLYHWPP